MEVWDLLSITNQLGWVAALSGLAINVEWVVCKHCTGTKLFQPITTWVAWQAWPHQTSNTNLLSNFEVVHLRSYFFHHSHNLMPVHMHHQSTLLDSFCIWEAEIGLEEDSKSLGSVCMQYMMNPFHHKFLSELYDITTSWSTFSDDKLNLEKQFPADEHWNVQ